MSRAVRCITLAGLLAGSLLPADPIDAELPHTVASPVPGDVGPYQAQYGGPNGSPCPSTLAPLGNAKVLRGKADLLEKLAKNELDTAARAKTFGHASKAVGNVGKGGAIAAAASKHIFVAAAFKALNKGGTVGGNFAESEAKQFEQAAAQMRAWAQEARAQANAWEALHDDCKDRYFRNNQRTTE